MTPIPARCAHCDSEFFLFALVEDGTGACPHCLQPLVTGDPGTLLEWAAAADAAHYRLSASVHILQQLRGHLIVDWQSVLQSLAEEAVEHAVGMLPPGVATENGRARLEPPARWRAAPERRRVRQLPLRQSDA